VIGVHRNGKSDDLRVQELADHGLLYTFGERIERSLSRRIAALTESLAAERPSGVVDLVPSYTTLLVIVDPALADAEVISDRVRALWLGGQSAGDAGEPPREVTIPVHYGGEEGPDLLDVARHTGLTPTEVIARHAGGRYEVGAIGFAPGFAFLLGLDESLATPRRTSPRTRVPAGSVAIGGGQTGMYSLATPGGWNLIGRTTEVLFDPERDPPSLLQVGDAVRFVARPGSPMASAARVSPPSVRVPRYGDALEVMEPGLQTTVQDLGRPGQGRIGVSPGGAADRGALIAGNRLVGNPEGAAGLEITLAGPRLRVLQPLRLAVTGADLGAAINGLRVLPGAMRVAGPGDEIAFGQGTAGGARSYLCVAGGIDVPVRLGSRSTDLVAGFGGHEGRPLRAGDRLKVGPQRGTPRSPQIPARRQGDPTTLRVTRGPQLDRFPVWAWQALTNRVFTVSPSSNRMGVRLEGHTLIPTGGADIISEGLVTGAIQVTGEGQPIIMGGARATIGGYPKIATVIAADLDLIGQLAPCGQVRFIEARAGDLIRPGMGDEVTV
jgi:KipI family sensor histidine kinase inhibitor